jgi:fucose permease
MTNQRNSDVDALSSGRRTLSSLVLGTGFGLTGAGTVMLGVLLPTISQKWGLPDDSAGFLFFLQFLGSSLGALLTGANRHRSLMRGYGLLVVSACALAFSEVHVLFAVFFFFGLGLGMAMTATSLLFSDRYGDDRAAKLERLNFAWSAGATAAPVLFLPFLHLASLRPLFFMFQGLFLSLFVWVTFKERQETGSAESMLDESLPPNAVPLASLLPLVMLAMFAVGVEGTLSGWLTTYSHRADLQNAGGAVLATSLFWFGIMLSRLVFSTRLLAMMGRQRVLRLAIWCAAASVALLIAAHNPTTIRVAAGLAGLGVGPLYPLFLSFLLERSARGWIFSVAGMGSALFPWLTGLLSAHYGSLRYGLIVPCGAALLMVVLLPASLRAAGSPGLRRSSDLIDPA